MRKTPTPRVIVKKSEPPETNEILAEAITRISVGLDKLVRSGLNRRAILALVKDATGLSKETIGIVLDSLASLASKYT